MADSPANQKTPTLHLKKGCAKPLHGGHPWVFADAVARAEGPRAQAGDEVRVLDERGTLLGRGFYSPDSAIAVRLLTRADAPITADVLESRIDEALRLRRDVLKLGAAVPAAPQVDTAGVADSRELVLLQELDKQLSQIQTFAAQYGMDAQEETGSLRKKRDELAKKLGVAVQAVPPGNLRGRASTAYRLINSEGDGMGGLTVDVYGDYLTLQIGTAGMERRRETILDALEARLKPRGILDRSDARQRQIEKLDAPKSGPLRGHAPAEPIYVLENGIEMVCDLRSGSSQKTGLYLDQRENRQRFGFYAAGRNVLDVFSYSGGFSLHAAKSGARSITLLESSEEALMLARSNLERNGVDDADLIHAEYSEGFKHLRESGKLFDLIVLDPPKFARGKESVSQALSGYRELNSQALRLLAPGGVLFTCSCSGNVSETDFERAVAGGIRASGRRAALLERRGAGPDHPVPPGFDQGRYLKCLVLQVV